MSRTVRLFRLVLIVGSTFLALSSSAVALPPLLVRGEITRLSLEEKKMFAPAVAGPNGSVLVFQGDATYASLHQIWVRDEARDRSHVLAFTVPYGPRIGYSNQYPARYASVATPTGAWLVGPTVEFLGFDGRNVSGKLKWPRNDVKAVALPDGSVVVVGGLSWPETRDFSYGLKAERVWLNEQNQIQAEELPALPMDIGGGGRMQMLGEFSVVHAGNGHVLLAGNEYRNLTLLLTPGAAGWRKLAGMKLARSNPALILLPDGRIWASGGGVHNTSVASTSEIWNPKTETWTAGPSLPVPMIDHSAVLTHGKEMVLLAGGYFPTVLAWKIGADGVFIAAQHAHQRRKAGVVLLPDQRLALVGGRYARFYREGWGRSSPGIEVVTLDMAAKGRRAATFPTTLEGALLEHQGQILAVGGKMRHSHYGSEQVIGTRLVERTSCKGNSVATLPALPIAGSAQAAWIDDTEALVHVTSARGSSLDRQWLGLINLRTGAQRPLPQPENGDHYFSGGALARMRLVGVHDGRGWLLSEDAQALRVGTAQPTFERAPRMIRQRAGFVGRVLNDGRVIVAGGAVQSELVAARTQGCTDCKASYIGFGPLGPSRHYEIFEPTSSAWLSSSPSRAVGGTAAVFADGRVAKLGRLTSEAGQSDEVGTRAMLEISDSDGKTWQGLELPSGIVIGERDVDLRTVANEADGLHSALFLGVPNEDALEWWWVADVNTNPLLWRSLGVALPPYQFPPGELDSGTTTAAGKKLYFLGGDTSIIGCARK